MNRHAITLLAAIGVLAVTTSLSAWNNTGNEWQIEASSLAGGGMMSGGDWGIVGTLGQSINGDASGGDWDLSGGFTPDGDVTPPCPGDIDGSGAVDVSDLLTLLGAWGPCNGCASDLDNNGLVDVSDLLTVLAEWGECDSP